jgi:hypothetical protein
LYSYLTSGWAVGKDESKHDAGVDEYEHQSWSA